MPAAEQGHRYAFHPETGLQAVTVLRTHTLECQLHAAAAALAEAGPQGSPVAPTRRRSSTGPLRQVIAGLCQADPFQLPSAHRSDLTLCEHGHPRTWLARCRSADRRHRYKYGGLDGQPLQKSKQAHAARWSLLG
jgi:hypothetical protein